MIDLTQCRFRHIENIRHLLPLTDSDEDLAKHDADKNDVAWILDPQRNHEGLAYRFEDLPDIVVC